MNDFIKIGTVFDSDSQRSVEELSKLYSDRKLLKKLIFELVYESLLKNTNLNGKKILLKPNWVIHSTQALDEICLRTNDNFLLTLVDILLQFSPQSILIGDAPIQRCDWEKMLSTYFVSEIKLLSEQYNIPIHIKDFRRVSFNVSKNKLKKDHNPISDYLIFDLGTKSYLEPICDSENRFRVTNYTPDRLRESHRKGVHKYCITKDFFDTDIVISIPKIKTHEKTGITCALKNIVGINGDKDYLPHHRIGGTGRKGDCYPGNNYCRYYSERSLDNANRNIGKPSFWFWQKLAVALWKMSNPKPVHQIAAGWYGNDTCWRMVMDLNLIAVYGTNKGKITDRPQRLVYSLCDGIIGGQGNGPLNPIPLPLGIISFSNNSAVTDIAAATLMGFDVKKIPLLKAALAEIKHKEIEIKLNDKNVNINDLRKISTTTIPPIGWSNYFDNTD